MVDKSMTYNQFNKCINKIIILRNIEETVTSALKLIDKDFNYFSLGKFEDDYVNLLKIAMNDKSDWIGYYIYECDLGKSPMSVKTNKKFSKLKTIKQLYNLLTEKV